MKRRDFLESSAIAVAGIALTPQVLKAKGSEPHKMMGKRIKGAYVEREITNPVSLCDSKGLLNPDAVGWSRVPLHSCNLTGGWPRKKKWHYWCVTTDNFLFSFSVANVDYIGLVFAYFLDYETQELLEKTVVTPFGRGCPMPLEVERSVSYSGKAMPVSIINKPEKIDVRFDCHSMKGKKIHAELTIHKPPGHETLNVVIPWSREQFQFTSKQNTLPTEGTVKVGDKTYTFDPAKSWATLDFGRGIWPYKTKWNWGTFSGTQDGDLVGINLGGKWTDGTGANENGICYNGKLFKIGEDLLWEYNTGNFKEPWRIRTEYSDALDLKFTPFFDKAQNISLGVLSTQTHQCFGHYTGAIKFGDKTINIKNLMGWAEQHIARW